MRRRFPRMILSRSFTVEVSGESPTSIRCWSYDSTVLNFTAQKERFQDAGRFFTIKGILLLDVLD